jgi:excisionase family DNA binding protein
MDLSTTQSDWLCRDCCGRRCVPYRYPVSHALYCSGCQQPMDVQERLAAALALLLLRLEVLASPRPAPTAGESELTELLTVTEAAKLLRLTPKAVRNRIDRGQLPVIRLGRTVRIRRRHVLAFPSERRAPSPGDNRR